MKQKYLNASEHLCEEFNPWTLSDTMVIDMDMVEGTY